MPQELTYLMVSARKRGDVDAVREAIGPVIEQGAKPALPDLWAMAVANRAWVAWRCGSEEAATADARAALGVWEGLPVRYFFGLDRTVAASGHCSGRRADQEAAQCARGMLPPPQQRLQEPLRSLVEQAVHAWDAGQPDETADLLRRGLRAGGDLGYL